MALLNPKSNKNSYNQAALQIVRLPAHTLRKVYAFFAEAAFMQCGNIRSMTLCTTRVAREHSVLACKNWPHLQA